MTELVYGIAVGPFKDMVGLPAFFAEVLIGGVFAGLIYSLVALGFVLIFKASGLFNFALGVLVLFAGLTLCMVALRVVTVEYKAALSITISLIRIWIIVMLVSWIGPIVPCIMWAA